MDPAFKTFIRGVYGELTDAALEALPRDEKRELHGQFLQARQGNNCVVFIMWLLSGEFYVIVALTFILFFCRNSFNDTRLWIA